MTQASMLHLQGKRVERERLSKALQLVQSTSPSYLLLASLDAARQQIGTARRRTDEPNLAASLMMRGRKLARFLDYRF
jgi:arginine/lysine/ornithine decarboxylase